MVVYKASFHTSNKSALAEKLVKHANMQAIHGGVILTRGKIRSEYWMRVLRQIMKKTIIECYGCKRNHMKPCDEPNQPLKTYLLKLLAHIMQALLYVNPKLRKISKSTYHY